jgi:pyrroline-5-carboxylate reductase
VDQHFKLPYKVGFLGTGNLAQAMIKGLLENKVLPPERIFGSNRSPGKLQKLEALGIKVVAQNEELINNCDVIVVATKPQDLIAALEPIGSLMLQNQIVISLAAGISLKTLQSKTPQCRVVRLMPNTPSIISKGVLGYVSNTTDGTTDTIVEDLFSSLGYVIKVEDEEKLESLSVACAAGTGFVFELMLYWQEWLEEHGFATDVSRKMTVETFLGAAMLASMNKDSSIDDLLAKVASKKGITQAGLESMRELEIERALRYSFEKAALRNQELAKIS